MTRQEQLVCVPSCEIKVGDIIDFITITRNTFFISVSPEAPVTIHSGNEKGDYIIVFWGYFWAGGGVGGCALIRHNCLQVCGTHAVVFLDLESVFELLLAWAALRTPPLQGHPGHPRPDQPRRQGQRRQGAHRVKHHLWAEAAAHKRMETNAGHTQVFVLYLNHGSKGEKK